MFWLVQSWNTRSEEILMSRWVGKNDCDHWCRNIEVAARFNTANDAQQACNDWIKWVISAYSGCGLKTPYELEWILNNMTIVPYTPPNETYWR